MIKSIDAMKEISKILEEVLRINSLQSVSHLQSTIEMSIRCINLADIVIKKESSPAICICYLTLCEEISKKLKNDCQLNLLSDMILQKTILVGETVKKLNNY